MDWTMVGNAKEPIDRIRTIFYLCWIRYEATAINAGKQLAGETPDNQLCKQSICEARTELADPSVDLGMLHASDANVREYLRALIAAYDQEVDVSD